MIDFMINRELQSENDLEKYQKRLNQLYRSRKQIVQSIKELSRRQRLIAERTQHTINPNPLIRDSSLPANLHQKISGQGQLISQSSIGEHPHLDTAQEEIKKVLEVQSAIKDRNRRLFGSLNTHLKKAQSKLSEESGKARSKLSIEERVAQKEREQSDALQEQKKQELKEGLERLNAAKESNSKELLATENIILKNKFIAYVSDLQHFLFTHTSPSVAWKPSLPHQHLGELQAREGQSLKKQTESRLKQIEAYNQRFDYGKYRTENQKEFYSNYLDNYFRARHHFIRTNASPPIYWTPGLPNPRTSLALQASQQTTQQQLSQMREESENFYKRFDKGVVPVEEHSEDSESDR